MAGLLQPTSAYSVSGTTVSFVTAPTLGQAIWVVYSADDTRDQSGTLTPAPNGSTVTFSFPALGPQAGYVDMYVSGTYQIPGTDYNLNYISGTWSVTFTSAPANLSTVFSVYDNTQFSTRNFYNTTPVTDGSTSQFLLTGGTPTELYGDVYLNRLFVSPLADYAFNLHAGVWKLDFTSAPTASQPMIMVL